MPCRRAATAFLLAACVAQLGGCAVIAVAGTAAGLAVTGAGLAVDAAIGAGRLTGRAAGAVVDAVSGDEAD